MKNQLSKIILISVSLFFAEVCLANPNMHFVIRGVADPLLANIKTRLDLDDNNNYSAENIQQTYLNAASEIKRAIEPFGYFHSEVNSSIKMQKGWAYVTYVVRLGPPVKIRELKISLVGAGQYNLKLKKYLAKFPLQVGNTFQSESYQLAKDKLFNIANKEGFIKAEFTDAKVSIDLQQNSADINLVLDTGEQYYFGEVNFNQTPYSKAFLQKFINFKSTDPFSSEKLISFQQQLAGSYYFTEVVATPDFNHIKNYHVPINLTLQAPKSQKYNVGVGYGTFTGPRVTAGVSFRRITQSGQHLDMQMQYSKVIANLAAKYYIPGANPLTDQWWLGANIEKFTPKNGSSTSKTFAGGYATKKDKWQTNINLNYLLERYKINNDPTHDSTLESNLLYPNLNLIYTSTNNIINPTNGYQLIFNLQGAAQEIFSATSFAQGEISGKAILSPADFNKIIIRGDLGYTIVENLTDLPLTMRYTTGGVNSVRGYADNSIGPGKYLEIGSIEYRNKLYGDLSGAVFYDIGTATNHFNEEWYKGYGVGLVYDSFIGPIKLYGAMPLDGYHKKAGFYFSIGPEF